MSGVRVRPVTVITWGMAALCILAAAFAFVWFFEQMPIEGTTLAIDWQDIYPGIAGARLSYLDAPGLRNPPWPLLPLLPLGLFSMRASWGLLNLLTLAILVLSVPRHRNRRLFAFSVLLLVVSYPTLRLMADGNLEGEVIAGVLLLLAGYRQRRPRLLAVGVLLVTIKPQVSFVLLIVLVLYVLREWSVREWSQAAIAVSVVVMLTMLWIGGEALENMLGIEQRGSIMDTSLWAALTRTGWFGAPVKAMIWAAVLGITLWAAWRSDRTLSRFKAALLMAASLLLAPYSAGNTILSVMAVGVIPLFQKRPWLGAILIALLNLPVLFPPEALRPILAWYGTGLLLVIWGVMLAWIWRVECNTQKSQTSSGAPALPVH